MKQTILLISILTLLTINPFDSFAKGKSGHYNLKGYALTKSGDTLKNQQIIIYFKNTIDTLLTDSDGYYKTKIQWSTACPSGVTPWRRRRATKKLNPKYIKFSYKDKKIKIKNDWRKFMSSELDNPDSHTKIENLIF